jgi:hypothetical protein
MGATVLFLTNECIMTAVRKIEAGVTQESSIQDPKIMHNISTDKYILLSTGIYFLIGI